MRIRLNGGNKVFIQRAKSHVLCGESPGWRIHGGGESTGKFGLQVKMELELELRGIFHVDSLGISRRIPAEFIRIFGGFIGDKSVGDFQGNPRRLSREIMGNL